MARASAGADELGVRRSRAASFIGAPGEPAFGAGWKNAGSGLQVAGFYRDQEGVVHLRGGVALGGSTTTIFTLPVGYRPAHHRSSHGSNQHDADNQFFHERGKREAVPDEYDRGGDNAHVIAIKHTAECRDERNPRKKTMIHLWLRKGLRSSHVFTWAS